MSVMIEGGDTLARQFMKARKWLAGKVLGEQEAFFLPTGHSKIPLGQLSNSELGMIARKFMMATDSVALEQSLKQGIPVENFMRIYSASAWAEQMHRMNASSQTITMDVSNTGDAAAWNGIWEIEITRMPSDYDFGPEGVSGEEHDGKLTKWTVGWKNPNMRKDRVVN